MRDHTQYLNGNLPNQRNSYAAQSDFLQNGKDGPCQVNDLYIYPTETAEAYTQQAIHLSQKASNSQKKKNGYIKYYREPLRSAREIRDDWEWIRTCHHCTSIHLDHSASFHQFYSQVAECDNWVKVILSDLHHSFDETRLRGDRVDAYDMIAEMKDVLLDYTRWQDQIEKLYDVSKNVHPLPLRHEPLPQPVDARMLCDYNDEKVSLSEDEKVKLLDNHGSQWKIESENGVEAVVPALTVVIPPPYDEAFNNANRLLMQLLAIWRTSVKRLGRQLIVYFLLVFRDWDENEVIQLQMLNPELRAEISDVTLLVESLLEPEWADDPDFGELQSRLSQLRLILEDEDGSDSEENGSSMVIVQVQLLKKLLNKYKDFCDYWGSYKSNVESLTPSSLIVLPETWKELRYITTAYYFKYYERDLQVDSQINKEVTVVLSETPEEPLERMTSSSVNVMTSEETSETDQIFTSVEEDQTTFVIEMVLDPRDNKPLTLDEAILGGIFDEENGLYCNPATGKTLTIAQALNGGRMCVTFKSAKKIHEEKSSIGLITIKTTKETRPYEITHVIDPNTETSLTLQKAIDIGCYDEVSGEYVTDRGERLSCMDAIDSGCVHVEYKGQGEETSETVVKTYAVHAVVDQVTKDKVSFSEGLRLGIVDKNTGDYYHSTRDEWLHVSEAIKRGFIKARVVQDDKGLNIDPENSIVVERIKRVKDKLLTSLAVARQLKSQRN